MTKILKILTISAGLAMSVGCQTKQRSTNDAETLASKSSARPLPIKGTWVATDVWGSSSDDSGQRKAFRKTQKDLESTTWRVQINIDSEGLGYIEGPVSCHGPSSPMSGPNKLKSARALNALSGLLSLPGLIKNTVDLLSCASSKNGTYKDLIQTTPERNLFGQPVLAKNLGVFGEQTSGQAVENECRKLRGARFINVGGSSACVGYTDGSASKLKFLIIPNGEIYAIRVNMTRD